MTPHMSPHIYNLARERRMLPDALRLYCTLQFALVIISRCGFGMSLPWTDISISEKGGMDSDPNNMSMAEALNVVSEQVIAKLALPSWVYRLPIKRSDMFTELLRSHVYHERHIRCIADLNASTRHTSK